jgi:hypothetical protein
MTTQVTATCQYCHATLPHHVSLATHYATCPVLDYCLGPKSPFPGPDRISEAETPAPITGAGEASRADEQHEIILARARLKAKKHR